MAKKRKATTEDKQRQSRKDILIARRHEEQTKRVRLLVIGIIALISAVLLIGVINELVLKPERPVAMVNGTEISMEDWRDQVEYRRALLVSSITDIANLVGGDFGQISQIAERELGMLGDPETLGLQVLEEMIDNERVLQEALALGITVTESEIQTALEERFNYFGGKSPTPQPTPTETIMPTPSLTPIAMATLTESQEIEAPTSTPTAGPSPTPRPSPTAVSLDSFQEALTNWNERLNDFGINEELFRRDVKSVLYRERLIELLADRAELPDEAEQASIFYSRFDNLEEAEAALEDIESSDFLTVWNTINTLENDEESESTAIASELLWRTAENLEGIFGLDISQEAFDLDIEEPSAVIVVLPVIEDGTSQYYIIMVSGREIRPLSQAAMNNARQQVYINWLDQVRFEGIDIFERWRANVPTRPGLDVSSWVFPTPVPAPTLGEPLGFTPVPTPG